MFKLPFLSRRAHERDMKMLYDQMVMLLIHKEELIRGLEAELQKVLEER